MDTTYRTESTNVKGKESTQTMKQMNAKHSRRPKQSQIVLDQIRTERFTCKDKKKTVNSNSLALLLIIKESSESEVI